jgi:hypothetical protein
MPKRRRSISAEELMAELESHPQWVAAQAERDRQLEAKAARENLKRAETGTRP